MFNHLNIGGVPEHFNLPWYEAIQQKKFEQQNIKLHWQDYPQGTGAMTADLRSGKLDMAVLLTEGIIKDIAQGNPSKIVQTFVKSPLNWGVHISKNSSIEKPEQIKGKKFAISRLGSGSHLMAYINAKQKGWIIEESQLEIVSDLKGGIDALKNNKADVFLWEKFITKPYVDKGEINRIDESLTPWSCFVIAVRNEVLLKRYEDVQHILYIIRDFCKYFKQEKSLPKMVVDKFGLKYDDAIQWINETDWAYDNKINQEDLVNVLYYLKELKFIEKIVPLAELYDTTLCELI